MNADLLLRTADAVESRQLGGFSMLRYDVDIAAYIMAAAEQRMDVVNGPLFHQAVKAAGLADDKLLWVGGWPQQWKDMMESMWGAGREVRAAVAALVIRDYVQTGGWTHVGTGIDAADPVGGGTGGAVAGADDADGRGGDAAV